MIRTPKKAGFTVAAMIFATALSKLLGMVRQILIAESLADSMEGIAFAAASKIPFSVFDMLFSAAVLGAFLPIYRGALLTDGKKATRFSSAFFTAVTLATSLVAVLGVIFARQILFLSAPMLDAETAKMGTALLRIMFPSVVFAGGAYILVGILQSHEKFILPACISGISNLVIIVFLLLLPKENGIVSVYGLAAAHFLSWAVQFLTLTPSLLRAKCFPRFTKKIGEPSLILALRRSVPVMLGSWLLPVGTLAATFFASFVPSANEGGAIVRFDYAFSVFTILGGILTYGICNFSFPKLSEKAASGDERGFALSLQKGLFSALALILPVAVATFFLSYEGISLLYERGNFTETLARETAAVLQVLAFAMPAFSVIELLSRAFYACGKVRIPMYAAATGIGTQLLSASLFLLSGEITVLRIALSVVLGEGAAALVLLLLSLRHFPAGNGRDICKNASLLLVATAFCAAGMGISRPFFIKFLGKSDFLSKFLTIAIVFLMGLVVYLLCMGIPRLIKSPIFHRKDGE